jgi:hypothetical protein
MAGDGIKWNAFARVEKYSPEVVEELTRILGYEPKAADFARFSADPYAVTEVDGNLITTTGLGNLTSLLIGSGGNPLTGTTSGRAFVGVGNGTTAAAVGDTDLGGASKYYNPFDSNPARVTTTVTNDAVEGVSTFGTSVANHAWDEWGWFTTTSGTLTAGTTLTSVSAGTESMVNHKIAAMGTKASGASWVFTTKVTFS